MRKSSSWLVAALAAAIAITAPVAARAGDNDDRDFLFRMGLLEGHLTIGHTLVAANRADLALPHFGHPVRELYEDLSGYLDAHGFPAFDGRLGALEAAVATAPGSQDTEAQYRAMIATVHGARDLAPAALRASVPAMVAICAGTIEAAAGEYGGSIEQGRIASLVEYHDSRGYLAWVAQQVAALEADHADAPAQDLLGRFKAVLAKAQWIVAPLIPDGTPRATVAAYQAIAVDAKSIAAP